MVNLNKKEDKTICKVRLVIAIVSFICGVLIASAGVLLIPPIGDYTNLALKILKEVLLLCGTVIGICNNSRSK